VEEQIMNKKYIIFAFALFVCFGCLKDLNASEMVQQVEAGVYELKAEASTEDLKKFIEKEGAKIVELRLPFCKNIDFTHKDINWSLCNLERLNLGFTNITSKGLQKILTQCSKLKELCLSCCIGLEFEKCENFNWANLEALDLVGTNITAAGLKNLLDGCINLKILHLDFCKKLDEKYCQKYETKESIVELKNNLKKDLEEAPKLESVGVKKNCSYPPLPQFIQWTHTNKNSEKIVQKKQERSWLVAKWQALPTHWKWTIGVGAVAIPVIGALIFYKKSHTIQKLSSALWRRLPSFLKRQKTVNLPLIAQNRYQI